MLRDNSIHVPDSSANNVIELCAVDVKVALMFIYAPSIMLIPATVNSSVITVPALNRSAVRWLIRAILGLVRSLVMMKVLPSLGNIQKVLPPVGGTALLT